MPSHNLNTSITGTTTKFIDDSDRPRNFSCVGALRARLALRNRRRSQTLTGNPHPTSLVPLLHESFDNAFMFATSGLDDSIVTR